MDGIDAVAFDLYAASVGISDMAGVAEAVS
jgi:hypothetical protein